MSQTKVHYTSSYAGITYSLVEKNGKYYIALPAEIAADYIAKGANMKLLDNLPAGSDPEDYLDKMLDSIP